MKSEAKPNTGSVAKVTRVEKNDSGPYICMVHPHGNSQNNLFPFNVKVTVDGEQSAGAECKFCLPALIVQAGICFRNSSSVIIYSSIL